MELAKPRYELFFIAEDNIEKINFHDYFYVVENYVCQLDSDNLPKAGDFTWQYSFETISLLIQFLFNQAYQFDFQSTITSTQPNSWVFDLTSIFKNATSKKTAEENYDVWIKASGRDNNFDEFCVYVGLADYINRNMAKKYLMLCVFAE